MRRAKFRESGDKVKMELNLSALLKTSDRSAMDQVSAGFATRLVYDLALFEWGDRRPVEVTRVSNRIFFDIFDREYVVEQSVDGRVAWVQRRKLRDDAVRLALALDVRVGDVSQLERGAEHVYVVRILAQRNPIAPKRAQEHRGRGQERSQGWFSDWVGVFVSAPPTAEYTIEVRSSAFYLVGP